MRSHARKRNLRQSSPRAVSFWPLYRTRLASTLTRSASKVRNHLRRLRLFERFHQRPAGSRRRSSRSRNAASFDSPERQPWVSGGTPFRQHRKGVTWPCHATSFAPLPVGADNMIYSDRSQGWRPYSCFIPGRAQHGGLLGSSPKPGAVPTCGRALRRAGAARSDAAPVC